MITLSGTGFKIKKYILLAFKVVDCLFSLDLRKLFLFSKTYTVIKVIRVFITNV